MAKTEATTGLGDHCPKREDYFGSLDRWLKDAQTWYSVTASFPYMFMSNQFIPTVDQNGFMHGSIDGRPPFGFHTPASLSRPAQSVNNAQTARPQNNLPGPPHRGGAVECRVAPVWKRFVAEFLDFLILFFLKLAATFIAIDLFDFINLDKYGMELFTQALDYKSFMELTSEIVILEIIHRVVVCIFEGFWLQRGAHGSVGGATPGKALMGLRVITCEVSVQILDRPLGVILVTPGTDLGLCRSILRAVMKNFILSVLFPLCIFVMFFKHNQTAYDVIAKSIVVETVATRERR